MFYDYLSKEYRSCKTCKCILDKPDLYRDCNSCIKICGHCPPVECYINNWLNSGSIIYPYKQLYKIYGKDKSSEKLIEINIKNITEKRKQ